MKLSMLTALFAFVMAEAAGAAPTIKTVSGVYTCPMLIFLRPDIRQVEQQKVTIKALANGKAQATIGSLVLESGRLAPGVVPDSLEYRSESEVRLLGFADAGPDQMMHLTYDGKKGSLMAVACKK